MTEEDIRKLSIDSLLGHYSTQCYMYADTRAERGSYDRDKILENMCNLSNEIKRRIRKND